MNYRFVIDKFSLRTHLGLVISADALYTKLNEAKVIRLVIPSEMVTGGTVTISGDSRVITAGNVELCKKIKTAVERASLKHGGTYTFNHNGNFMGKGADQSWADTCRAWQEEGGTLGSPSNTSYSGSMLRQLPSAIFRLLTSSDKKPDKLAVGLYIDEYPLVRLTGSQIAIGSLITYALGPFALSLLHQYDTNTSADILEPAVWLAVYMTSLKLTEDLRALGPTYNQLAKVVTLC